MTISFDVADKIFSTEKTLLKPLSWKQIEVERQARQRCKLECRVEVEGGVPRGVFFRISAYPFSMEQMTFQLEADLPDARRHVPLYRLEIDPIKPHLNKMYGGADLSGMFIDAGQNHEHIFYDSLTKENRLRSNSVEQARAIEEVFHDYSHAVDYVCKKISLMNCEIVPPPPGQGALF